MIPLPKNITTGEQYHPVSLSIDLNLVPLSTASIELPKDETLQGRELIELFCPIGSVGVFRVRSPQNAYGDEINSGELEHAVAEVGDYLVRADIDKMESASTAMSEAFSYYGGDLWQLGSLTALGDTSIAFKAKYDRVLDAMLSILEQKPDCMMSFDFSTTPWTINFATKPTTVTAEGRLSRNVSSATVTYDDTELCTRVWYEIPSTDAQGAPTTVFTHMDADTMQLYGLVEREFVTGSDYTEAECDTCASSYLEQHKRPKVTVSIDAEELSSITGESLDSFSLGEMFRLALPDYDTTVLNNITSISWSSVYDEWERATITLGDEEDDVIKFLHNVDKKTGGGGGGGSNTEKEFKAYYTEFEKTDFYMDLYARHVTSTRYILQQAGMYIDANGVLQYAEDNTQNIMAQVHLTASGLRETFTDDMNSLRGYVEATASHWSSEFTDAVNSMRGYVEATASHWQSELDDGLNSMRSVVEQTASSWSASIEGVVGSDGRVTAASISVAINSAGEGVATIDASKIYLLGNTIANTITADYINNKIATIGTLTGISASFSGNVTASGAVKGSGVYVGNHDISNPVMSAIITTYNNQYRLTVTKADGTSSNYDFSPSATSLTGGWSSGAYTVTASPQGNTISTELGEVTTNGDPTASGNTLVVPVKVVLDDTATTVFTDNVTVVATDVYNNGYNAGKPNGTITIGSRQTGSVYNVSISRSDNTALATTKDFSSIYADARDGYTAGVFTLADITLQGASDSVYVEASSGGTNYYKAGTAATYYNAGTTTKNDRGTGLTAMPVQTTGGNIYYQADTAVTYYKGDGDTVIGRGTSVTRYTEGSSATYLLRKTEGSLVLAHYGTATLYASPTSTSGIRHNWYYVSSSGTAYYQSDGSTTVTLQGTSGTYYLGNGSEVTGRGNTVSVTPVKSSTSVRLGSSGTYYPGNGGSFTVQGSSVSVTPIDANSKKMLLATTRYKAGTRYQSTYYTKS